MSSKLRLATYFLLGSESLGYIWNLKSSIEPGEMLRYSEHYMFSTGAGPALLDQGDSYVQIEGYVTALLRVNRTIDVYFVSYACDEPHGMLLKDLCYSTTSYLAATNSWAFDIQVKRYHIGVYEGVSSTVATNNELSSVGSSNGQSVLQLYRWLIPMSARLPVLQDGWRVAGVSLCVGEKEDDALLVDQAVLEGKLTFKNPYGYLSVDQYGYLPFEGARMIAYTLLGCVLAFHFWRHRASVQLIHGVVFVVFLCALAEAIVWYATYQRLNLTGQPYCCPFPALVEAALMLQIFRQTAARALLLIVSLGYGIVRPKLQPTEWASAAAITVLYFVAASMSQVSEIASTQSLAGSVYKGSSDSESASNLASADWQTQPMLRWQVPALFMDALFLTWICMALASTQRILRDYNELHKLGLYLRLSAAIAVFTSLFGVVAILNFLAAHGVLTWPWRWAWLKGVVWEGLNFAVLTSVCIICLPTDTSHLLAYSAQLPTDDPDEYDGDINQGHSDTDNCLVDDADEERGHEHGNTGSNSNSFGSEEEDYEESRTKTRRSAGTPAPGSDPDAEDFDFDGGQFQMPVVEMNQLKEAEKNATKLVQDARRARIDRMKEAKVEAEQAIQAYRAEMEKVYQEALGKQTGAAGSIGKELDVSTSNDIAKMSRDFASEKGKVVDSLVGLVLKVNLTPPTARA